MAGTVADAGSTRAYMGSGGPVLSSGCWRVLNNRAWVPQHVSVEQVDAAADGGGASGEGDAQPSDAAAESGTSDMAGCSSASYTADTDADGPLPGPGCIKTARAAKRRRVSSVVVQATDAGGDGEEGSASESASVDNLCAFVDVFFRWDWRDVDGSYVRFDAAHCAQLEASYRKKVPIAKIWLSISQVRHFLSGQLKGVAELQGKESACNPDGADDRNEGFGKDRIAAGTAEPHGLRCRVNFEDMTATVTLAGRPWLTSVRRWDATVPMGDSWDHQDCAVRIIDVEPRWREFSLVSQAFFDRQRSDGVAPRVSRETHRLVRVRRIQNRGQYRLFDAHRKMMMEMRGDEVVMQSEAHAWHGTGRQSPLSIASAGFMAQCCSRDGFYLQGFYTAQQASYSHHPRFVYRSSDLDGQTHASTGVYHHLLLVRVLRGVPLRDANTWRGCSHQDTGRDFAEVYAAMLGSEYDSVEGGPHRPTAAGPGVDDSLIYVLYHPSQVLPEFIVTYVEV